MKFTKLALVMLSFLIVLIVSSLIVFYGCTKTKNNDVVLKINDVEITRGKFYGDLEKIKKPHMQNMPEELKKENSFVMLDMKRSYLNNVIIRELLKQEFEKRKIEATEQEIEKEKAVFIAKAGSEEKFYNTLKTFGVSSEQLKDDISIQVKTNKLVESLANSKVSTAEAQAFYKKNKAHFTAPQRVRAYHILIDTDAQNIKRAITDGDTEGKLSASEIETKTKAEVTNRTKLINEIRQKAIKNPKKFQELAKEYSQDPGSAEKGGDLGYIIKSQVVKEFGDAAFSQKVGVVGPLVKTQFGTHIILVTDKIAGGVQPFATVKNDIMAYLNESKKREAFNKFTEGLKKSAKIEYLDETLIPEKLNKQIEEALIGHQKFQKTQRAPKSKKKILDKIEQEQKAKKEAETKK